jgi:hypothetical protein
MAGGRDTKSRAQRIDLHYLSRPHWLRTGRVWLGLLALVVAGAWIAKHVLARHPLPASPGPVSLAHRMLGDRCETCHADRVERTGSLRVTNDACQHCHAVPDHQPSDGAASCASCHVEHRGRAALADVATERCTACHGDLAQRGTPRLLDPAAERITTFDAGPGDTAHPEFRIWLGGPGMTARARLGGAVPSQHIKFAHALHVSPQLCGPDGTQRVKLHCGYCHQEPLASRSRFGTVRPHRHVTRPSQFAPAEEPRYFAPIRYEDHCAACHPHSFDKRIEPAPHDTPYVVRQFLEGAYARYARRTPDVVKGTPRVRPIADGARATSAPTADDWVASEVDRAEKLLYRRPCDPPNPDRACAEGTRCLRCVECHDVRDQSASDVPEVVPPAMPARWLPQSRFDHGAHRELQCTECHGAAATSTSAADVLMPGIATCRRCHHGGNAAASNRCAECHTYHGAMKPRDLNGRRTIDEITGSSAGGGT